MASLYSFLADALPKEINKPLTHVVATLVEAKWDKFLLCLGRKSSAIAQYKQKSEENFVRAIWIIDDWVAECGREATANALIEACEECGIHKDTIEAAYRKKSKS